MKVKVNGKIIYVWLSKAMFKDLNEKIEENNKKANSIKFRVGIAAFLFNIPSYLIYSGNEKYENTDWIPICSAFYKNIYNGSKYIKFLIDNEFLDKNEKGYSTSQHQCNRYRINSKYRNQVLKMQEVEVPKKFNNKYYEEIKKRKEVAKKSTGHLTKWLDVGGFEIDANSAKRYINKEYKSEIGKKNKRIKAVDTIGIIAGDTSNEEVKYSREGKDNRLHSMLTRLPKDIKQFITYKGGKLVSIDISNSQPFTLINIMSKGTQGVSNKVINKFITNNKITIPIMFDDGGICLEVKGFIDEIVSGELYTNFGKSLYSKGLLMKNTNNNYFYKNYPEKGNYQLSLKEFKSIRDAGKTCMIKVLFSMKSDIHAAFREFYPVVNEKILAIKSEGMKLVDEGGGNKLKADNSYLPILLQKIEADCILDFCTKKIAEEFPDMPLFTIHDSIITTENNIEILHQKFKMYLSQYYEILPELKIEPWSLESQIDYKRVS